MSKIDLKIIIALSRANQAILKKIEKSMNKNGLTVSEFGVMELLLHKGKQPVQKIAERILVTSGTITYVINKLIKKGYIKRERCNEDKRIYYVDLTEEGRIFIEKVFKEHEKYLSKLFQEIDNNDKKDLIKKLNLFENVAKQYKE
ncbi:MarR family winged helix-turn-helix transcriptional regulator [Geotoga petraea]|jgi:MarR family 2-MHQ and catechol resistance regulon transcriptional repressor|uniref:Transcriptional regulator, MarR family n=1 Tax=Geotoga petraea TaxID=28234 RepID=A0A1G6NWI6_9BACT|nr:MarR family transcriptional regulator [Geotoga petraea]SDC72118.1 transcriptional regulator, MarR family [Geotoga petraea]